MEKEEPSASVLSLLDLGDALDAVVARCDGESLAVLACVCAALRTATTRGAGAARWSALAVEAVGGKASALRLQAAAERVEAEAAATDSEALARRRHAAVVRAARAAAGPALRWSAAAGRVLAASGGGPRRLLARSGHTATLIDEAGLLVVAGGLMARDDDDNGDDLSVLCVRLGSLELVQPAIRGPTAPPCNRLRHAAVRFPMRRCLRAEDLAALGMTRAEAEQGAAVVLHGGYDARGSVFSDVMLLWVARDGSTARWARLECGGAVPKGVYHHTLTALRGDPAHVVSIGGETAFGFMDPYTVYMLDLAARRWERWETERGPRMRLRTLFHERWLHGACLAARDFDALATDHEGRGASRSSSSEV